MIAITLPDWPEDPNTPAPVNMEFMDACREWSYEMARADAAMARLRLAMTMLEKLYGVLALDPKPETEVLHEALFKIIETIGPLPPEGK